MVYLDESVFDFGEGANIEDGGLALLALDGHGAVLGALEAVDSSVAQHGPSVPHEEHVREPERKALHHAHGHRERGGSEHFPGQNVNRGARHE